MSRLRHTCSWPCRRRLSPRARFWRAEAVEAFTAVAVFVALGAVAVFTLSR